MGVRLCLHPWLLAGQGEGLDWLSQDCKPGPLPLCPAMPGLRFDSPACLLAELRKEEADTPIPLLSSTLRAPIHIRNRILELLPSSEQLKAALASPKSAPVQIGKRRGEVTPTEGGSQLPAKMSKMEGLEAPEEQTASLPFISEEIYRLVRLEEAKAAFKTNKGRGLISDFIIHLIARVSYFFFNLYLLLKSSSPVNHFLINLLILYVSIYACVI